MSEDKPLKGDLWFAMGSISTGIFTGIGLSYLINPFASFWLGLSAMIFSYLLVEAIRES